MGKAAESAGTTTKKKRGQGEGSISRRPDGSWWARITVGKDENGKQLRKAFYGHTRQEVQRKLNDAMNDQNPDISARSGNMTVEQWVHIWLQEYHKLAVRASTYCKNSDSLTRYLLCEIGNCSMKNLKTDMIQNIVNGMVQRGYSYSTIKHTVDPFRACISQAVNQGFIKNNVVEDIVLPTSSEKKAVCLVAKNRNYSLIRRKYILMALFLYLFLELAYA